MRSQIFQRWDWRLAALAALMIIINIYSAFSAVTKTEYRSTEQVFDDFMGGPLRLLFPVVVALIAASATAAQLTNRHIASTRTRMPIRRLIVRRFSTVTGGVFVLFFLFGMLSFFCAFVIVPALFPSSINPGSYGLHSSASVLADAVKGAPLTGLLSWGPLAFGVGASAWLGLNAAVFAAVALVCVFIIRQPIIAFLVPFAIYLFESVALQVLGFPGSSFLISAVYPSGLQSYPLAPALIPTLALGVLALVGAAVLLLTTNRNSRLS